MRETPDARIALVGGSRDDVAKVMIEGPSGLVKVARANERVQWKPTLGTVRFSSGAMAFVYSAEAGEALRGPEHHFAWADELAKWGANGKRRAADAAWDNLMMGLRLGAKPRVVVTTTPRPVALLERVRGLTGTKETGGRTDENAHLPDAFVEWMRDTYGGTRIGRQELGGELIAEVEGALFSRELLEQSRATPLHHPSGGPPPPGKLGEDLIRVVAEKNQGGDMVASVLANADVSLPVKLVSASRGKVARAEPVAALFENGRAKLAGRFPELEDELAGLLIGGDYAGPGRSPDRADACVWAITALMKRSAEPRLQFL